LKKAVLKDIEQFLSTTISNIQVVNGGDINQAFLLESEKGRFFLKYNTVPFAAPMFEAEAKGLSILSNSGGVNTPTLIHQNALEDVAYLLLDFIEPRKSDQTFWQNFGRSLADLHKKTAPNFGLDHANYIGRLKQTNHFHKDWDSFYIHERLIPQVKLAQASNLLDTSSLHRFEQLYKKIKTICPAELPALCHGDLWNGNFLVNEKSEVVLIDPSVSYTHREMDIAMTLLFGGFSDEFYSSYNNLYPLEPGLKNRVTIYQLYYLLVHLNLFGSSYLGSVKNVLNQFQ